MITSFVAQNTKHDLFELCRQINQTTANSHINIKHV